jgi:flagellar biosynthetic protein FliR
MPGELALSLPTLFSFLFVLARVGGALIFVPLPSIRSGPEPARVLMAVTLSIALYPLWPAAAVPSFGQLALWMFAEAAFGITVGIAVSFLVEALLMAAQVFGLQAGYSYASTIDPSTQADSNVLLVVANLMAGLLFFALGLDGQVVRIFARSLEVYPPGSYLVKASTAQAVITLGGGMFATGMRLALPVVVLLVLVDVALALLGRIHQQLQLLTLAFPLKMLASLLMLAAVLGLFLPVFRAAAERTFSTLVRVL